MYRGSEYFVDGELKHIHQNILNNVKHLIQWVE